MAISIHAPTGGATRPIQWRCSAGRFQSTLPRGERLYTQLAVIWELCISIHAPTGGATTLASTVWSSLGISIHAPTGGATFRQFKFYHNVKIFQSTLPRGERRSKSGVRVQPGRFQSTLPRGERQEKGLIDAIMFEISIHAPTGGATVSLSS